MLSLFISHCGSEDSSSSGLASSSCNASRDALFRLKKLNFSSASSVSETTVTEVPVSGPSYGLSSLPQVVNAGEDLFVTYIEENKTDSSNTKYSLRFHTQKLSNKSCQGSSSSFVDIQSETSDVLSNLSLALFSQVPVVAYKKSSSTGNPTIVVKKYNSTSQGWEDLGSAISNGSIDSFSLSIQTTPFIAYKNSSGITVVKWDGTQWQQVGSTLTSASSASNYTLSEVSSEPLLAVRTSSVLSLHLRNGSSWGQLGSNITDPGSSCLPTFSLDFYGRLNFSYKDSSAKIKRMLVTSTSLGAVEELQALQTGEIFHFHFPYYFVSKKTDSTLSQVDLYEMVSPNNVGGGMGAAKSYSKSSTDNSFSETGITDHSFIFFSDASGSDYFYQVIR